jgi:hypothetical protein
VELRNIALLVAVVVGAFGACTRVESASSPPGLSLDGGAAGESAGGAGSLAGDSGDGSGGEYVGVGGAPGTIEVGVWPTFAADPNQSRDVQAVLAAVSTLSIGASTLPIAERWEQLSGATGSPRAATWNRLDAMTKPFRDRGAGVALCIDVVDRTQRAWPFAGELDSAEATSAIERTIDEVFARYAAQLSHLCFGYELDRYLALASRDDQGRLLEFLRHAVDYATHHPQRGPNTAIGTAVTLQALSGASSAPLGDLILGDEVVAVYDPLDEEGALKPPESVVEEVSDALDTLATGAGSRLPLTLFEVGYPSSSAAGSSEKAQLAFYSALFGLLDTRRADFGFVGVYGLADRADADCEAEALAFLGDGDSELTQAWATARCSMGLRAERPAPAPTTDKLAWPELAAALSRFR